MSLLQEKDVEAQGSSAPRSSQAAPDQEERNDEDSSISGVGNQPLEGAGAASRLGGRSGSNVQSSSKGGVLSANCVKDTLVCPFLSSTLF